MTIEGKNKQNNVAGTSPKELTLKTDSGLLTGLEWGQSCDRPVLALHGWLDNAASFLNLGKHLHGFHTVAIDLPGHGKSVHRSNQSTYHFIDYVNDVLNAADSLGWSKFTLVGHSLGAGIASILAGAFPDRITNMVLIDGIGPIANVPGDAPNQLRQALIKRKEQKDKEPKIFLDIRTAMDARKRVGNLSDESAKVLVERALKKSGNGYSWSHDRRLTIPSPIYMTEPQVLAFLRSVTAPTLLLKAIGGIVDRFGSIERIVSIPNISVIELSGGHHLHMENPLPVAEVVLEFLANAASTSEVPHPVPDCLTSS